MKTQGNILIVDDDIDILETARMFLKQEFASVDIESQPEKIAGHFERKDYDVVLLDMNFKKGMNDGEEGFYWLNEILKMDHDASVILITAYGEVDLAVKAMKQGATDFVLKPWKNQKLLGTINSALKLRESRKEVERLKESQKSSPQQGGSFIDLIGNADALKRVKDLIRKVAVTAADVLILGENGTGKEVAARNIHHLSDRKDEVFIHVDLGAISETLFESELFGHVKGAFTDAKQDKPGRFEIAQKGTIFLDEIGNLSLPLQAKLLTVLQSRKVRRVGSNKDIDLDVRLICATNMPINDMVAEQTFRQDLLYRINTVEIRLPALRERKDDIPLLTEHFLKIFAYKYHKRNIKIADSTLTKLQTYPWPGNIRELQHAVERAVILSETDIINSVEPFISTPHRSSSIMNEEKTLDEMERDFILQTLERNNGNVTKTAKVLGLSRTALYRRMHKHGI
ncbi:sigma-54-dependent transcriptional regulator [Fulvivirga sediminis]|uniref:Sigma-54-dependent Fis family transcriptional regulator n=1 Tax=Fulvivirga sediminis TaxID=2803949 RepID=A0A937FCK6_9BACT|nr:sigma-54 dependent transcriptional regulator [Fulvivirga sediminis]MBL3658309.1 sigma-54-dependent Fis family transcriptional regulator [Fulvivirga sediminis]